MPPLLILVTLISTQLVNQIEGKRVVVDISHCLTENSTALTENLIALLPANNTVLPENATALSENTTALPEISVTALPENFTTAAFNTPTPSENTTVMPVNGSTALAQNSTDSAGNVAVLSKNDTEMSLMVPLKLEETFNATVNVSGEKYCISENALTITEHSGTHIDAPTHYLAESEPEGKQWTLDKIPLERLFLVPARVIRLRKEAAFNPDYEVTEQDILKHEEKYGRIRPRSVVLFDFGWADKFGNEQDYLGYNTTEDKHAGRFHFPGLGKSAILKLLDLKVAGVGTDCLSPDPGYLHDDFSQLHAHLLLLPKNVYLLKNMGDMSKLPPRGAQLMIGAMKIEGSSGSPATIAAMFTDRQPKPANKKKIKERLIYLPKLPIFRHLPFNIVLVRSYQKKV